MANNTNDTKKGNEQWKNTQGGNTANSQEKKQTSGMNNGGMNDKDTDI